MKGWRKKLKLEQSVLTHASYSKCATPSTSFAFTLSKTDAHCGSYSGNTIPGVSHSEHFGQSSWMAVKIDKSVVGQLTQILKSFLLLKSLLSTQSYMQLNCSKSLIGNSSCDDGLSTDLHSALKSSSSLANVDYLCRQYKKVDYA